MNKLATATIGSTIAIFYAAQTVSAFTVQQTQELSNSVKVSGNAEVEVTQHGKQSQFVDLNNTHHKYRAADPNWGHVPKKNSPAGMRSHLQVMNNGEVRLTWNMRGGTCHVRYTEAQQSAWSYHTAAGCDQGGVMIGGLRRGQKYKFQVRQDDGAWSRVMVNRAK